MDMRIHARMVERLMFDRDMKQIDLVEISGISKPTLNRLLEGKPFTSGTLARLAQALGCNPIDLLDTSEFPDPHLVAPDHQLQPAYR